MPDAVAGPAEERPGPGWAWSGPWAGEPSDGPGDCSPEPVAYSPYIEYRGSVLWHNHEDALHAAHEVAANRRKRHEVRPKRVPGWQHLLWHVRPA